MDMMSRGDRLSVPAALACLFMLAASAAAREPGAGAQEAKPSTAASGPISWLEKINLSGILNGEGRWSRHGGVSSGDSEATSDLYIRQFSLGIEARLLQGTSATVVLNSEWIGDDLNKGDGKVELDEIHFDIESTMRVAVGRQTQPFGQFASDLVTDPMTQDAYEVKRVGATLGIKGRGTGDVSATVYKGTEQMDQLFQSDLFDTAKVRRQSIAPRTVDSFIGSAQMSPWVNHLTVFGAWLSEPGNGKRNTSADGGFSFVPPGIPGLTVNLEYIHALSRELYAGQEGRHRESVFSASASYAFVVRELQVLGRRNYLGRRSSRSAHPVVASVRYESFDDDGLADASGSWSVKSRVSIGSRYAFRNDGSVLAFVQAELRHSRLRGPDTARDQNLEAYIRVGMDF
jgi:hypothetical protein